MNQGLIRTRATSSAAMERTATLRIETAHARTTAAYAEDQVCKRPAFRELAPGFTPNIVNHGAEAGQPAADLEHALGLAVPGVGAAYRLFN